MKPGQVIDIQLVDGNARPVAVANISIDLSFYTNGNFRYRFGIGRTNDSGQLTISYADVEAIRRKNAEFDLMDYNTKLEQCDPRVEIVIDSEEELRDRYNKALRSYGEPPAWGSIWPSNASIRAHKKSVELVGPITRVEITSLRA
jgi:hypothetical protein